MKIIAKPGAHHVETGACSTCPWIVMQHTLTKRMKRQAIANEKFTCSETRWTPCIGAIETGERLRSEVEKPL